MLTQVALRTAKLPETATLLLQADAKAEQVTGSIDALTRSFEELQQQAKALGDVEKRVQALAATTSHAEARAERLVAADGSLEQHRRDVQQLSAQARETADHVETLKRERAALEEFRTHLRQSHEEMKDIRQSVDQATDLKGELDQLRAVAGQLGQDYGKLRDTSRGAREDSTFAVEAVKEIENKLGRLAQLHELSKATDEKLTALNAMAEHVSQKTKVLEGQRHIVERAVAEANHVNEMVWNMDVQIGKLNEGLREATRGEEIVARIDKLVEDTHVKVETAAKMRDEFVRETARMERDGRALASGMRASVEQLSLEKQESEVLYARLRALRESVQDAEQRMEALSVKERHLSHLPQRVDEFGKVFETLSGQADELTRKQASLETLREGLSLVNDLSGRFASQYESLKQSRADLEALRKEIQDFHRSYAEVAQLRDKLGADRAALEAFTDRLGSFRARVPEIQATMDAILGKLVDEGARQAARIGEVAAELDAHVIRLTDRTQVVATLEGRLNALHAVASDVDSKLAFQLARRAELDALTTKCDGVIAQLHDAQQKVDSVAVVQDRLLPMEKRLTQLQAQLRKTGTRVKEVQRDEAALASQEARLTELVEASRSLANDAAQRMQQVQALTAELARSAAAKDELVDELARVQARQRDALARADAAEDQLRRAETMYTALEQRRTQFAFSEKKLAGVEIRMAELTQVSAEIERRMKVLAERDAVVQSVKAEVEGVHQISAKSREDLQYVSAHREDVAALRGQVQDLLARAGEAEGKIASIEAHRKNMEEVQAKATLISNLLEDVRVNLETVSEQKAVVDHLTDKLANLDSVTQEAQNTLRMLSRERELAERIEQSIKQLRGRTGAAAEEGRQSA